MDWQQIVFKTILRNARRYLGYLLACTLAIAVFGLFMIFAANSHVVHGYATSAARVLFTISQVIVGIFAVFFIFYFHASLIRVRNKEFGLLLTLGMNNRQLGLLIFYESVFIGLIALALGLGLGILSSLPFTLAVGALLALPSAIPFELAPGAVVFILIFFGCVFLLDALLLAARVALRTPRMLILGSRTQQKPPRASWWLVILGLACISAAYVMAIGYSSMILLNSVPIIGLTIIGTYLLFSQVFVMLLGRLRRRTLKGTSLLTVSRLSYRMKDYARMITTVTVLNAMVLTGLGGVFGVRQTAVSATNALYPFALELTTNSQNVLSLTPQKVRAVLQAHGLQISNEVETPLLTAQLDGSKGRLNTLVLARSSYQRLHAAIAQNNPSLAQTLPDLETLAPGNAYVFQSFKGSLFKNDQTRLHAGQTPIALHVQSIPVALMRGTDALDTSLSIVVDDQTFTSLNANAQANQHWQDSAFGVPDWQQSQAAIQELRQPLSTGQQALLSDEVTNYTNIMQFFSVMLFAGFFVSLLFFLAAGASLYFKLFNQQEEDRRQFRALERVGLQRREASRVLTWEFLLLFFVPVALAILHSGVAMLDLTNILLTNLTQVEILPPFSFVCAAYVLCFSLFFLIARFNYARRIRQLSASVAAS